jgi:hypothetical protein
MTKDTGGAAFPDFIKDGMTLRDYFAAKAMQAFISSPHVKPTCKDSEISKAAYLVADAMLKAREQ